MRDDNPCASLAHRFDDDSSDDEISLISRRFGGSSMQTDPLLPSDDLTAALRASELRLSAFLEDRSRLARDLHDIVLQSLYAIGLGIETARRKRPDPSPGSRHAGDLVVDQLNRLIQQVRGMIRRLESGTVEEFDLATEIEALTGTYMQISPIVIEVQIPRDISTHLTREEKQEIVNIAREAVSNCVRHAKATHVTLALTRQGSRVRLLVSDNGIGFTPGKEQADGYGLSNMAARARKLGGRLRIRSQAGGGTRVDMDFVLEPAFAPL